MEKEAHNWFNVCLPAEMGNNIQPPELAEHYVDGLLWKQRFSREVLHNFKTVLGSVGYGNQLLQDIITELDFYRMFPMNVNNLTGQLKIPKVKWDMFLDSAQTEKKENDPSGIIVATKFNNNVYIRKAVEKKLVMPDLLSLLKTLAKTYDINTLYVEPKSNGKDVVSMLRRETDINVVELPSPTTDKTTRINAVSPLMEARRLVFIEDQSNDLVIDQLTQFPRASHDEFVDLVGYALQKYIKSSGLNYLML